MFGAPGINDSQKNDLVDLVAKTVKTESWQAAVKRNDWTDLFLAGDEFKTFLDAEQTRIAKVVADLDMVEK